MPQCNHEDGCAFSGTLRQLKRHYKKEHSGDTLTDDEHLPEDTREQRDFAGETPSYDEHGPEYVETNEPPETERTSLREYADEEEDTD